MEKTLQDLSQVRRRGVCFPRSPGEETAMKLDKSIFVTVAILIGAAVAGAQQAAPAASAPPSGAAAAPDMSPVANPGSGYVKAGVARYEKNMVSAAEAMPAEKYSFNTSPAMNSYRHLRLPIA